MYFQQNKKLEYNIITRVKISLLIIVYVHEYMSVLNGELSTKALYTIRIGKSFMHVRIYCSKLQLPITTAYTMHYKYENSTVTLMHLREI